MWSKRLVDCGRAKLGMTPAAIRARTSIPPKAMPYKTAHRQRSHDSVYFPPAHMKLAMEVGNWKELFQARQGGEEAGLVRASAWPLLFEVCGTRGERPLMFRRSHKNLRHPLS